MEDPNTAHYKISNRGSHIHDASSEQDVQDLWKKNRPTTLKIQQYIEVSSDHRSQSHFKLQSCLTTEYALGRIKQKIKQQWKLLVVCLCVHGHCYEDYGWTHRAPVTLFGQHLNGNSCLSLSLPLCSFLPSTLCGNRSHLPPIII